MQSAALTLMPIGFFAMGIGQIGKAAGAGSHSQGTVAAGKLFGWFGAATFLTGLGLGVAAHLAA